MKRNLLRWSGLLVMLAGLPALSSAQNSKRLTVPGINNFWFVDKTVSTGGSITSRDLAMPALKKRGIRTVIDLAGMALMIKRVLVDGWTIEKAGIEAAASGLIDDNAMAPVWWKFAQDYIMSHKK